MSGKTLSPAEAIAHLVQRSAGNASVPTRRRTQGANASNAADARSSRNHEAAVWRHKFRVGETVTLVPNRYGTNRLGSFKVTFLLPQEQGINQYRLRSTTDGHERVATESELS